MPHDPIVPAPLPPADPDPKPRSAPEHHADHIPLLYGTDPLNPIFAPPVLIDDDELTGDLLPSQQNASVPDAATSTVPGAELDAIPAPEPASPSLPAPDPGIFHPDPAKPRP